MQIQLWLEVCCRRPRYLIGIQNGLMLYNGPCSGFTRYVSDLSPSSAASVAGQLLSVLALVDGVGSAEDVVWLAQQVPPGDTSPDDVLAAVALVPFVCSKSATKPWNQTNEQLDWAQRVQTATTAKRWIQFSRLIHIWNPMSQGLKKLSNFKARPNVSKIYWLFEHRMCNG